MLAAALILQGKFIAIAQVSDAFVNISNTYIRPAIGRMERLSDMPPNEWHSEKERFLAWCDESTLNIEARVNAMNEGVDIQVREGIVALHRRAIEAKREEGED